MTFYPDALLVRPLTAWIGDLTPENKRRSSPFSAALSTTLTELDRELSQLSAKTPVLEVAIPPEKFRVDGRPRADARAEHPGVVLSLPQTSVGALRYATDRFLTWQDNLRAITLGLEALRKVDRYGITKRGEQYTGFKALPPGGIPMPRGAMTRDEAIAFLSEHGGTFHRGLPHGWQSAYRDAAKHLHPDTGGDTALFQRLQDAARVLRGTD